MKLLAINFGGLGDEVLFLPTLKSIKQVNPGWEITLLTEPRSKSIIQLSKLIDKNIVFDIKKTPLLPADYLELVSLLRAGKYDIVLSSGSSSKVAMLLFLSGIKTRVGYGTSSISKFLLTSPVPLNKDQYAGNMYHDLVKGLKIDLPCAAPRVDLDQNSIAKMSTFLKEERAKEKKETSGKLVLIHPGMSLMALKKGIIKTWAPEYWAELAKRLLSLNHELMLCGGPDDGDTIADITKFLGEKPDQNSGLFLNAYGKTGSVQDLAALMELSDLIICVDSAPMHIAAAMQKRIVALFGPTDPAKLLLQSDRVVAISEEKTASPDLMPAGGEPCVRIPLDIVFQTAMDQLNRASVQESSLEFLRH